MAPALRGGRCDMRIAFVANNTHVPWGGSEELWSLAALRLREKGVEVLACVQNWRPRPPRLEELARAGAHLRAIRPVRAMRYREWLRSVWRREPRRGLLSRMVDDAIVPFAPDLVVVSQMHNLDGIEWAAALGRRDLPYALLGQAACEYNWPADAQWRQARVAYAGARASFFVSRHNLELTQRELGMELANAAVVRNPFLVRHDAKLPWPSEDGEMRLACVARLAPAAKGQDLLFQALHRARWRDRALSVSLFGGGGNEASLRGLAEHLDLRSIRFRGHEADVEAIWREHHALVLPSRFEGLPLALVEAMLCGRPAIVTPAGGNAELVEEGVTGFVADAISVDALDEALERAWQARSRWRAMGEAAAVRARAAVPADPAAGFAATLMALAA
jgi:glycosyltransferase involved in cell wall biosynthesis